MITLFILVYNFRMKKLFIIFLLTALGLTMSLLYITDKNHFQDRKFIIATKHFVGSPQQEPDFEKAIKVFTQLAEADHMHSQCFLGFLYYKGYKDTVSQPSHNVEANHQKAQKWLNKASQNHCPYATYLIAHSKNEDTKNLLPNSEKSFLEQSAFAFLFRLSQLPFKDSESLLLTPIFALLAILYL